MHLPALRRPGLSGRRLEASGGSSVRSFGDSGSEFDLNGASVVGSAGGEENAVSEAGTAKRGLLQELEAMRAVRAAQGPRSPQGAQFRVRSLVRGGAASAPLYNTAEEVQRPRQDQKRKKAVKKRRHNEVASVGLALVRRAPLAAPAYL